MPRVTPQLTYSLRSVRHASGGFNYLERCAGTFLQAAHKKSPFRAIFRVRPGVIETPTDPWQGPVIPLNQGRSIVFLLFY